MTSEPRVWRFPPPPPTVASTLPVFFFISFALGLSIIFSRGAFSEPAMWCVFVALLILVLALQHVLRTPVRHVTASVYLCAVVWVALLSLLIVALSDRALIIYPVKPWALGYTALGAWIVLLAGYLPFMVLGLKERPLVRHARFTLVAAVLLLGGYDTLKTSPTPWIDVWTVQQAGAGAFLQGKNPYQVVFMRDTGPRQANDVPYVYPPTQIYLTAPSFALGGDVRWTMLAALMGTGVLFRFLAQRSGLALPGLLEDAPALFLWFSPKLFFILEQSWVDPVQLFLITAALSAHVARRKLLTAVLFGVVASAKQTMFWSVPLVAVLLRFDRRQLLVAAGVAVAAVLPFALWDFRALKYANLDFLNALPVRPEALTLTTYVRNHFQVEIPTAVGFLSAAAVVALSLWRLPRGAGAFAFAVLATYFLFFVVNKWAFANYYFLLTGLSGLAAAASGHLASQPEEAPASSGAPST